MGLRKVLMDVFNQYLGKPVDEYRDEMRRKAVAAIADYLPPGYEIDRVELDQLIEASIERVFGKKKTNLN